MNVRNQPKYTDFLEKYGILDKTRKWGFSPSPLPLIFDLLFNTLRRFPA